MKIQQSTSAPVPPQKARGALNTARDGQVMILFALATVVLIGAIALAVDVGFLMAERRQVQAAADAAAMAGAKSALDSKPGEIVSAATLYGEMNAGTGSVINVNPNATGLAGGDAERYVEVTITKDVQKFFLGAIYGGSWTTSATALAAVEPENANYALITLSKDADPGIYMNGNTNIRITGEGGSAASNSSIRGSNNTDFEVEGAIHAYGDIDGPASWENTAPKGVRGNRGRYVDDPIAKLELAPPTPPAQVRDQEYVDECLESSPCQLDPGRYTSIEIGMGNNDVINLSPGLYYFDGNSSFDLKNKSELNGDGVLLYFTGNSSLEPKNGNINLRAASLVGDDDVVNHDDMVIWVENCSDVDLQGNGDMYFQGIFYAPCSHSLMHGNTDDTVRGQVVLGSLEVKGGAGLGIAYEQRAETSDPAVYLVQ